MAEAVFNVGMRMLQGQGIKYTDVPIVPPLILAKDLPVWVPAGWNENASKTAEGPDRKLGFSFLPEQLLQASG